MIPISRTFIQKNVGVLGLTCPPYRTERGRRERDMLRSLMKDKKIEREL
ncbi:MAG: hypothetical protein KJ666_01610 [Bacteroidetes bacterium]|nr:hypothetical protein [Bacteroidota bacterium]